GLMGRSRMQQLAPWTDAAFADLRWDGRSRQSASLSRLQWQGVLANRKQRDRPLAHFSSDIRLFGPFALRRTALIETSNCTVRLELGRRLELGVGMPKWLKSGQVFVNDEELGKLSIGRGLVAFGTASGAESLGKWRFEGGLLSYMGTPEPVIFGEV